MTNYWCYRMETRTSSHRLCLQHYSLIFADIAPTYLPNYEPQGQVVVVKTTCEAGGEAGQDRAIRLG